MVSPTNKASNRTKNRIREHNLVPANRTMFIDSLNKQSRWFKCRDCAWVGWLPIEEFQENEEDRQ